VAFAGEELLLATPDTIPEQQQWPQMKFIAPPASGSDAGWVLDAEDYEFAAGVAAEHNAQTVLLLGGSPAASPRRRCVAWSTAFAASRSTSLCRASLWD
jgi:hypothetical protein